MTTAARQARWRANDAKALVQVRLTREAVERLDKLVQRNGWTGRAEAVERLIQADAGPSPEWIAHQAVRLARGFFQATGRSSLSLRGEHAVYTITRYMER
jgi:hypothetical protein